MFLSQGIARKKKQRLINGISCHNNFFLLLFGLILFINIRFSLYYLLNWEIASAIKNSKKNKFWGKSDKCVVTIHFMAKIPTIVCSLHRLCVPPYFTSNLSFSLCMCLSFLLSHINSNHRVNHFISFTSKHCTIANMQQHFLQYNIYFNIIIRV